MGKTSMPRNRKIEPQDEKIRRLEFQLKQANEDLIKAMDALVKIKSEASEGKLDPRLISIYLISKDVLWRITS